MTQEITITISQPKSNCDRQLFRLENGYLAEIGEEMLTDEKKLRLIQAIQEGHITFILAWRGCRAVGMCSVAPTFSTFACTNVGTLEDVYVEPPFADRALPEA